MLRFARLVLQAIRAGSCAMASGARKLDGWFGRSQSSWVAVGALGTVGVATAALVVSLAALGNQRNQTRASEAQVLPFIDVSYLDRLERDGSRSQILAVSNYGAPLRDLSVDEV